MSNIAGFFRGRWPACSCQLAWLPVYEAELLRRKLLKLMLDVFQLIGGAPQSEGVHAGGGANDTGQMSDKQLTVSRNMGCADSPRHEWQGFDDAHAHGVLKGCRHAAASAKAQVREIDARGDGLRGNLLDIGPRKGVKWPLRNWKQGIKWAAAQLYAQSAKKLAKPVTYYATANRLAGRSYPGVGPVLIRRPRGFKVRAVATYTAPDGSRHVRTKYGTWYAAAYLAPVKPPKKTKPKPAIVHHKGRPPLGPPLGRFLQWNLAVLNARGKVSWPVRRKAIAKIIVANNPDVLFLQETPKAAVKWLDGKLGRLTQRVGAHGRYIYLATGIKVHAWVLWTPETVLRGGKAKPVVFAAVHMYGADVLLVNCHPQAGAQHGALRERWAIEVIEEAERRADRRGGIPIIYGGDFQGGEFARVAKLHGARRSVDVAHTTVNAKTKTFNKWSTKPAAGYQMDQIITSLPVEESRTVWNGTASDHNRVRATIHQPVKEN